MTRISIRIRRRTLRSRQSLPFVGYRHIHLDPAAKTIYLDNVGTKISLGGIAKGYAVDGAARVLRDAGLSSFYVQAGGDLFAAGRKPDGSPWSAGIRDPRGPEGAYFAVLPVSDHAFSTAGDYERSYVIAGKRYHHIIDPRTGRPATASRSVTIYAPTALLADEIDDAVFILGPKKGLLLVESIDSRGRRDRRCAEQRARLEAARGEAPPNGRTDRRAVTPEGYLRSSSARAASSSSRAHRTSRTVVHFGT